MKLNLRLGVYITVFLSVIVIIFVGLYMGLNGPKAEIVCPIVAVGGIGLAGAIGYWVHREQYIPAIVQDYLDLTQALKPLPICVGERVKCIAEAIKTAEKGSVDRSLATSKCDKLSDESPCTDLLVKACDDYMREIDPDPFVADLYWNKMRPNTKNINELLGFCNIQIDAKKLAYERQE